MEHQGKRLDITAEVLAKHSLNWIVAQLAECSTVHLSGRRLHLSAVELEWLMRSLHCSRSCTELFVFRGGDHRSLLTEALLARYLPRNLTTLMLWEFDCCGGGCSSRSGGGGGGGQPQQELARALRHHPKLKRVTLNLPANTIKEYGALDVLAMGLAAAPQLQVLQMRVRESAGCAAKNNSQQKDDSLSGTTRKKIIPNQQQQKQQQQQQQESLISPEALAILLSSANISSLYLENCGLIDDHVDVVVDELQQKLQPYTNGRFPYHHQTKKPLQSLDLSNNLFTDDALFSAGRLLAHPNCPLASLDLSGVEITERGGQAVAQGLSGNTRLLQLELEGARFYHCDEFFVPPSRHAREPWMQQIRYQLRLNRAVHGKHRLEHDRAQFVEALSSVSDQVPCLYALLRKYPKHANHLKAPAKDKYVETPSTLSSPTKNVKESVYDVFAWQTMVSPKSVTHA